MSKGRAAVGRAAGCAATARWAATGRCGDHRCRQAAAGEDDGAQAGAGAAWRRGVGRRGRAARRGGRKSRRFVDRHFRFRRLFDVAVFYANFRAFFHAFFDPVFSTVVERVVVRVNPGFPETVVAGFKRTSVHFRLGIHNLVVGMKRDTKKFFLHLRRYISRVGEGPLYFLSRARY